MASVRVPSQAMACSAAMLVTAAVSVLKPKLPITKAPELAERTNPAAANERAASATMANSNEAPSWAERPRVRRAAGKGITV